MPEALTTSTWLAFMAAPTPETRVWMTFSLRATTAGWSTWDPWHTTPNLRPYSVV